MRIRNPVLYEYPKELVEIYSRPLMDQGRIQNTLFDKTLEGITLASHLYRVNPEYTIILSLAVENMRKDFQIYNLHCRVNDLEKEIREIKTKGIGVVKDD
jgi:hypothetical protein